MKKLFILSLAVVFAFVGMLSANAMSEAKLKEVLTKTYNINGTNYSVSSEVKVYIERYLNENEVSSDDADYIAKKVDQAVEIVRASGATDLTHFTKLPKDTQKQLKTLVADISANTSVKATVTKNSVAVTNADGTVVEVTGLVKQTGSETNIIAVIAGIAFVVTVVGACLVVRQVKHIQNA